MTGYFGEYRTTLDCTTLPASVSGDWKVTGTGEAVEGLQGMTSARQRDIKGHTLSVYQVTLYKFCDRSAPKNDLYLFVQQYVVAYASLPSLSVPFVFDCFFAPCHSSILQVVVAHELALPFGQHAPYPPHHFTCVMSCAASPCPSIVSRTTERFIKAQLALRD